MTCDTPLTRGPNAGQPAKGTRAGYDRHYAASEVPCAECKAAAAVQARAYKAKRRRPAKPRPPKIGGPQPLGTPLPAPRFEPAIVGSKMVWCACGRRGMANSRVVKGTRIQECRECR
jgi:hypothetical protein